MKSEDTEEGEQHPADTVTFDTASIVVISLPVHVGYQEKVDDPADQQ